MSDVGRAVRARLSTKAAMINSSIATGPKVRRDRLVQRLRPEPMESLQFAELRFGPTQLQRAMAVTAPDKVPMK